MDSRRHTDTDLDFTGFHPQEDAAPTRSELNLRTLINANSTRLGVSDIVAGMSDLEAVRFLQERESYQSCYGREVALQPGPDGSCNVRSCCWRNFCSAYRSTAPPVDLFLPSGISRELCANFSEFLTSRLDRELPPSSLGVAVTSGANLTGLSRKLVIGAPRSVVTEIADASNGLRPIQMSFSSTPLMRTRGGAGDYLSHYELKRAIWWTAAPGEVFNWLTEASNFIETGSLDFMPHLTLEREHLAVWKTNKPEFSKLSIPSFQRLDCPHQATQAGDVFVSDPNFVPLLNLEIPYLESASLEHIHQLMVDYPEELETFRAFLFRNIEKIKDRQISSASFGSDLNGIRFEIDDQLRKLRSDFKKAHLKHMIEISGAAAAAFVLSVYCFTKESNHTWALLGPGGFTYVLSSKISEYLNTKIALRDNPLYFVWMIGPGKRL